MKHVEQGLHTWFPLGATGSAAGVAEGGLWSIEDRLLPPGVLPFADCNQQQALLMGRNAWCLHCDPW